MSSVLLYEIQWVDIFSKSPGTDRDHPLRQISVVTGPQYLQQNPCQQAEASIPLSTERFHTSITFYYLIRSISVLN